MPEGTTVHGTCVVVGEDGILIRGEPGSGKSTLAREIVERASEAGRFARLVSDDRTRLAARHGRLVAGAVAAIAGRLEVRGIGIVRVAHEPGAVVRLVVDLVPGEPPRLPEPADGSVTLCGISVPRLRGRLGPGLCGLVLERRSGFRDTLVTE
jgi:serine kinase of HPr protein (carbohydrate metabolism regulator)